jgi:hypothetical protein
MATSSSWSRVENSPHMEAFKAQVYDDKGLGPA